MISLHLLSVKVETFSNNILHSMVRLVEILPKNMFEKLLNIILFSEIH